jgi:heterotetrameric sarcosine oxidase gamma subunit
MADLHEPAVVGEPLRHTPTPEPLARSPIAPPEPVIVQDGWQVSAVRARGELTLTDCTPLAKVAVAAHRAELSRPGLSRPGLSRPGLSRAELNGVRFGRAARDQAGTLVVGSGPGEWLLIGPPGQASALEPEDEDVTCVDLTHGRALVRLTGDRSVAVLAKVCGIDFADRFVPDGSALRTAVAAVATDVIRDDRGGARSYLLHCERSSGQYLFDALLRAGAEIGLEVDGFHGLAPGPPA